MMQDVCLPGKCVRCGIDFDGGNRTEVMMALSDGSSLRIGVCLGCRDKVFSEDKAQLWSALMKGWEAEIERNNWPPEKRERYMSGYRKKWLL